MSKEILSTAIAIFFAIIVIWLFIGMQATPPLDPDSIIEDGVENIDEETNAPLISLTTPRDQDTISSPLVIEGKARGYWFFEATFPITLTNWDGLIIAEGYAEAVLDPSDPDSTWMTEDFVPFRAILNFTIPEETLAVSNRGSLILHKDNPSGLPEHDDALEITVFFKK